MSLSLSVVIPTYNRRDSLRLTLDGLAAQTLPADQWEAIIVSDGSTDGTDAFLKDYAASAPFALRSIHQDNAGPSRARNEGIREAQGEVVVFVDDDVEPLPEFLATHLAHHHREANVAIIGPLAPDRARRKREPVWIGWEHAMLEKQYFAFRSGKWAGAGPNHFYSGNASVRREHLVAVGGFDTTFTRQEDVELAMRMEQQRGVRYVFDADAAALHRPARTWNAWLKVPYAYGKLDVIRARRGDLKWEAIKESYTRRDPITRLLASVLAGRPRLSHITRGFLRNAASALYRAGLDRPSYAALSAVYNVRYLEAASEEMNVGELASTAFRR